MEISEREKKVLLLAARQSIKSFFEGGEIPSPDYDSNPDLKLFLGAFVTLKIEDRLRGCIGYIITQKTLFETVCEAAKQAAFRDPRFLPVTSEELNRVSIEISVLSEPEKIKEYNEIIIGKHGLILQNDAVHAVLLPQVAVTNNFTLEQFLSALCEKGGLYPDYWKDHKLNLLVFTATIFSEEGINL
jgi:AmmeMemoRadiSam system protein A